jgi:hypothetical protein
MAVWLTYFDSDGFECFINVDQKMEKEAYDLFVNDQRSEQSLGSMFSNMKLRARFNSQRKPEIWTFNADNDFDEDTLWSAADADAQWLADWIRKHGTQHVGETPYTKTKQKIV